MAFTIPPANKVQNQGGFITDIDNAYAALAVAVGVNVLNAAYAGGADNTGANDSGAAFIAAKADALSRGVPMFIPGGTYSISATLDWTDDHLNIAGAGMEVVTITQATGNIPVIHTGGHYQRISGMTLSYSTPQAAASTGAIAMSLGSNSTFGVDSRYADIRLLNGQTLLARDPSCTTNVPLFSCIFDNIRFATWSQSAINLTSTAGQMTGCAFRNIHMNNGGAASAGPVVVLGNWTESTWDQVNVENCTLTTSAIVLNGTVGGCGTLTFNSVHCEVLTFNTTGTGVFELADNVGITSLKVSSLTLQGSTIAAGITTSIVRFTSGFSRAAIVDGLWLNNLTLNAGASLYFADFSTVDTCRAWLKTARVASMGFMTGLSTGGLSGCAAFWNNLQLGVLGPPAVPATTVAFTNNFHCHAQAYVTAGAAATTVAVDGSTMGVLPANTVCGFHVPANSTITLTYASGTPTWAWYGAGF